MPKGGIWDSNFDHIMREISPEALAGLLSNELILNSCKFCAQKNSWPCDRKCFNHILEWLNSHFDEDGKKLIENFKTWEEINE